MVGTITFFVGLGLGLGVVGASTLAYFFLDREPPPIPRAAEEDDWMELQNDPDVRKAPSVAVDTTRRACTTTSTQLLRPQHAGKHAVHGNQCQGKTVAEGVQQHSLGVLLRRRAICTHVASRWDALQQRGCQQPAVSRR